ncbi:la-related protein 1C-like [Cicer arietinum]|uniref:La-related protein 1C-like n=1 Tax=Cicer arietinum TaxID=3827 RepID=A0A1S3E7X9_CICAR|nr:la-related protein 1C-like [Cicer arietinum]
MVTHTADSSSNHHSPTTTNAAAINNPNYPRKNLPSPWIKVVRGADSEPLNHPSPPSSSSSSSIDSGNSDAAAAASAVDNSNADKNNNACNPKNAWKNPSNGISDVSPVMGAVSWPALSAKPTVKLSSDSSSAIDGSISIPQGSITSHSPQKHANANVTVDANVKPTPPINCGVGNNRQRSTRRGGGNGDSNTGPSNPVHSNLQQSAAPPFPVLQIPTTTSPDGIHLYRNNNGWSPRSPVGVYVPPVNEHRSPSHRGNHGNRPHNNYGVRRNQGPGNLVNTRDPPHLHQRMHSSGFLTPTLPNSASYLGHQSLRPFVNQAGFHEFCYYPTLPFEPFGGMPFLTHPPPPAMFFPVAETQLINSILNQVDYYFSDANLVKDDFLRSNMDECGWVSISLIANFPRVKNLTNNIELILESLRTSLVVEVQGDKLRRRNEWMRWLPSAHRRGSGSISPIGSSCNNNIAADFDKITIDEATTTNGEST